MPRHALTILAALLFCAATASADEAADALLNSRVCRELGAIAARQWERIYSFALDDAASLAADRYDFARQNLVPAFVYAAGRAAFLRGDASLAAQRLALAQRLAGDSGDAALARRSALWSAACQARLKPADALPLLQKASLQAEEAEDALLFAYILDKLGPSHDAMRNETWRRGLKRAEARQLPPEALHARLWLAFRLDGAAQEFIAQLPVQPLSPAQPWQPASGDSPASTPLRRITGAEIYDAESLMDLSCAWAGRAYDLAAPASETRARAALRLGRPEDARRIAQAALGAAAGSTPAQALQTQTWRVLKAAADEAAGRFGAILEAARRLVNPAFAAENKPIYPAVCLVLAEALLDEALDAEALAVAQSAVDHLEKHYRSTLTSGQLFDYYEQTRPVYALLGHACLRVGDAAGAFAAYGPVYPWHREAWLSVLRSDPLFCVRYSALLFDRCEFALARELLYNYRDYGLIVRYPHARQLHSAGAALEYLYRR